MRNDIARHVDASGRVTFAAEDATELLLRGYDIATLLIQPDDAIDRYNELCTQRNKATHRIATIDPLASSDPITARAQQWFVPDEYRDLPVRQFLLERCERDDEIARVNLEMDIFEARGWLPVLRLMCFLVDDFRARNIVWGVGRGSSVASYCLFLIGVHKVDSLFYDLPINEFLKD